MKMKKSSASVEEKERKDKDVVQALSMRRSEAASSHDAAPDRSSSRFAASASTISAKPMLAAKGSAAASMPQPTTTISSSQGFPGGAAAAPSPKPAQSQLNNQARPLDKFILLQGASGAFSLNDAFTAATSLSAEKITSGLPEVLKNASVSFPTSFASLLFLQSHLQALDDKSRLSVWVSAIALAYLHQKFAKEQADWELIKEKLTKFIGRTLKPAGISTDDLLAIAAAFIM